MKTYEIMYKILKVLYSKGYFLHYLQAFSTTSCYIKADWGQCGSIRISDHNGIEKYNYKFNIIIGLDTYYEEDGRKYYTINDLDKFYKDIKDYKQEKLDKYGFNYYTYMLTSEKESINKKGFFQNAKIYEVN